MFKVSSGTIIKPIQVCQVGRGKRRQGLLLLPIQPDDSVWPYKEVTITFPISLSVSLSLDHSSKTGPKDNYAKGIWFHHTQSCRVCLPLVFVVVVFASRLSALAKLLGQWRVRDDSSHDDGKWTPVGLDRCQLLDWVEVCKVF